MGSQGVRSPYLALVFPNEGIATPGRAWKVCPQAWGADLETEISLAGFGVPEGLGWNWQYVASGQVGEGKQKFT